jgi:hypothetical protein
MFKDNDFQLSQQLEVKADSGFQGIKKIHSKSEILHNASKLNEQQKQQNKKQASKRVPVEHTYRKCKIFKICGSRYRGKHQNYEKTWILIIALVNLKESTRHLRFSSV